MVQEIKAPPLKKKKKTQAEKIDELMDYIKAGGSIGLEMQKKFEELPEKYVAMLVTKQGKYDLVIANLVKNFCKKNKGGIIITINKSGRDLLKLFEKNKIDSSKLFIIDAVSKEQTPTTKAGNIAYLDSPKDLTEIEATAIEFAEKLPKEKRFLIFDSLSTLLIYNADRTVEKFVHSMAEKLRSLGFQAVFTIMDETKPEIMNVLSQFCDKVIKLSPQIKP